MIFSKIENKLEQAGHLKTAQLIRLLEHYAQFQRFHSKYWVHQALRLDYKIRETVQREIHIKSLYESYNQSGRHHPLTDAEFEMVHIWQDELDDLDKTYWCLTRELNWITSTQFQGPLKRAYAAHHSNPSWYLSANHRRECAERGGCCARDCGCCGKPRETERFFKLGHCTEECPCCRKEFGEKRLSLRARADIDFERIGFKMERAYIWGI
ncbi:uncharacterized protein CDV56_102187 [Aspergillus thermomutatus]|uniref:Uncharacterized protein n=1 Tax=Aspergillus thermomutatus TaxID=41047 RepID=A0A397GB09_ASPTH|nr:uncharacterized protein CDV56_102187 [Aspergillus thermomutatus]RHZ46586.1 hypothetical protein CDV56_102187 [Aspergillus thermomutatus]